MPVYHVKCYETVNFTVSIEADTENEARELARADINSHEIVAESTSEWDIEVGRNIMHPSAYALTLPYGFVP